MIDDSNGIRMGWSPHSLDLQSTGERMGNSFSRCTYYTHTSTQIEYNKGYILAPAAPQRHKAIGVDLVFEGSANFLIRTILTLTLPKRRFNSEGRRFLSIQDCSRGPRSKRSEEKRKIKRQVRRLPSSHTYI